MSAPTLASLLWWWLLTLLAFIGGSTMVAYIGARLSGTGVGEFMLLQGAVWVGVYVGLLWTFLGMAGAAILGHHGDPRARLYLYPVSGGALAVVSTGVVGAALVTSGVLSLFGLTDYGALGAVRRVFEEAPSGLWLALALTLTFAPAFGEEVFFRGLILRGIDASGRRTLAVVASSLLFGLTHFDVVQSAFTVVLGAFIAWTVLLTGSLWTGIVAHAVNNAMATLLLEVEHALAAEGRLIIGVVLTAICVARLRRYPRPARSVW